MLPNPVTKYDFGAGDLYDLEYLMTIFKISRTRAKNYLRRLGIPLVYFEDRVLFSIVTFQRILFCLMRPGGPGFSFPGAKETATRRDKESGRLLKQVPEDIIDMAADPSIIAEMAAACRTDDALLRKLISQRKGKE